MGVPTYGTEMVTDDRQYENSISQVSFDSSRVWGAAFYEAWLDNPIASIYRMSELSNLKADEGENFDIIRKNDFDKEFAALGLTWDERMTWATARELGSRKTRERRNQFIMGRGRGGAFEVAGTFGSSLIASLLDPVNIAMSFLPVVSAPKYAQIAARASKSLGFLNKGLVQAPRLKAAADAGSTWARIQIGAIDSFVGSAVVEPITYIARTQEQADYTYVNSLNNILIGTFLGAGLHAVDYEF